MHGHKQLGEGTFPLRMLQTLLQQGQADQGRGWIDIHKLNARSAVEPAVGTGHKGNGAGPQTIARTQAQGQAGRMQSTGGTIKGHCMVA